MSKEKPDNGNVPDDSLLRHLTGKNPGQLGDLFHIQGGYQPTTPFFLDPSEPIPKDAPQTPPPEPSGDKQEPTSDN